MRFELPVLLMLAPVFGAIAALLAWRARRARVRLARAWSPALGQTAAAHGRWTAVLIGAVAALVGLGASGPRAGRAIVQSETRALNVVLVMDISRSMLAEDVAPSRLGRAIRESRRLSQELTDDRVGLIAFAGRSYILAPLTLDRSAVELNIQSLDPDMASEGGTTLHLALAQAGQVLGASGQGGDRVVVLFTDGESHDSLEQVLAEARKLRSDGVTVVVVGEGGVTPVRIPLREPNGKLTGYKEDGTGGFVQTARDDEVLHAVAQAASGTVVSAGREDQVGAIREVLRGLERRPASESRVEDLVPRAWVLALLAFLLLAAHALTRRGPALAVILLALGLPHAARAQRPSEGQRQLQRGNAAQAEAAFLREATRAPSVDTAWYNAGTAALRAGHFDIARQALARAATSLDPSLRYRALYNHGVAALLEARADSTKRDSLEVEAAAKLREALLLEPSSQRAKWNLELALRQQPPPSGGGGGNPPPPPPAGPEREDQGPPARPGAMSRAEAEAILSSVERTEQATRAKQNGRRVGEARGKDW